MKVKKGLTKKQERFIAEYIKSKDATFAAKTAGYKNPSQSGCYLTDVDKYPLVVARIKALQEKVDAGLADGDSEVLSARKIKRYIDTVMSFQPLKYFTPGKGGWETTEAKFHTLPEEIGQLIEEITVEHRTRKDPETDKVEEEIIYCVKLVSKTKAMDLAAKHRLGEVVHNVKHVVNWDALIKPETPEPDSVEAEIARVMALPPKKTLEGAV